VDEQRRLILDQFTRQAVPFAEIHARDGADVHRLLMETAGITASDHVLDVACGPGLVACDVAKVAKHVTGIDLTPAMIDQAEARQRSLGLVNLTWVVGDACPLPFPDAAFSRVITRYSFHHFGDPAAAFAEMVRVCRPGGRVTVADVFTTSAEQAAAYDRLERLRDPSHTHALQLAELDDLFSPPSDLRRAYYRYPVNVDDLLSRSFPVSGGADAFRRLVEDDVGIDRLGIQAAMAPDGLRFAFPVVIVSGRVAHGPERPGDSSSATPRLRLLTVAGSFAVCKLPPGAPLPPWATAGNFFSVARTGDELSVVCPQEAVPDGVVCERDWSCLRVAGAMPFTLVGVLASLTAPIAQVGVGVLAFSTFDTDYLLVKVADLPTAVAALRGAGHEVGEYQK
jgi:ubiquinone/menaquinone biosynthesis C-methylase UbiE